MCEVVAAVVVTDHAATLLRIHARIVAAIHTGDRVEMRKARRCYRRALSRVATIERWRRRNGYSG